MMKLGKIMSVFALLVLAVLSVGTVSADSPNFEITKVKVDGEQVSEGATDFITIERGEDIEVEVWVTGEDAGSKVEDVRVKAWIGGYEFGDVSEKTSMFKVEANGAYKKTLSISLPNDLTADSGSGNAKGYTLHVEAYDSNDEDRESYTLRVDEKRHDLRVVDVIFRPGVSVDANDMLFTNVRVENMGDRTEKDIQVKVSIPELGFLARDYLDELVPEDSDNDDRETSSSVDLFGRIPRNAETGEYEVKVELIYNRGHEVLTEEYDLFVNGVSATVDVDSIVTVDSALKSGNAGEEVVYKFMIANFGDERVTYSAEVMGVGTWGTASVDPAFTSLNAGETGELYVKVTPLTAGDNSFSVKVKANENVVKEVSLQTSVAGGSDFGDLRKGLEVGFAVLAILLVILGLIIAFTKLKGGDDEGEEPELESEENAGQTYY